MKFEDVAIATPCTMRWEQMEGEDAQRRRCGSCAKTVHNLSAMTRAQAEALVESRRAEGLCVIYEYTPDGQLLLATRRLPATGPRRQLRGARKLLAAAAMLLPMLPTLTACGGMERRAPRQAAWDDPAVTRAQALRQQERRAGEQLERFGLELEETALDDGAADRAASETRPARAVADEIGANEASADEASPDVVSDRGESSPKASADAAADRGEASRAGKR